LVITLHGTDVALAERSSLTRHLVRRTFGRAAAVTATSDDLTRRAVELGADPRRTVTTHLGVDAKLFSPRPADPHLRHRLGASDGELLVVSVGRLAEVKGFEYLVAAAPRLEKVAFAIVGDGERRGELERRAQAAGASVVFTGAMPHDRIAEILAAADVVVVPSIVDRAGRVDATTSTVPEALACGRPLVASDVGGIPEIVHDGDNGLLVPPKDPIALAAAIERLRGDPELRRQLGQRAREFALVELSWDATIGSLEQTLERAVQRAE
jgi:glycosyltransferase involved in cell wall biosynthesis